MTTKTNYARILENPHFRSLATVAKVPFRSQRWRKQHSHVEFWTLLENLDTVTKPGRPWNKTKVYEAFADLLSQIAEADTRLSYTTDDIRWLVTVLDGDQKERQAIISLWKAFVSAREADT